LAARNRTRFSAWANQMHCCGSPPASRWQRIESLMSKSGI